MAAASSFRLVASTRSLSCSRLVALAIGDVTLGRAITQAIATLAGFESYCLATWSKAVSIRQPRSLRYFFIPAPRWLLERSSSERYLPVRNPLARGKYVITPRLFARE